jgi:hypothetical protein
VAKAAKGWRCSIGQACYDPRIDYNHDAIINIQDIIAFTGK